MRIGATFYVLAHPQAGETDAVTDSLPTDDFIPGEAWEYSFDFYS